VQALRIAGVCTQSARGSASVGEVAGQFGQPVRVLSQKREVVAALCEPVRVPRAARAGLDRRTPVCLPLRGTSHGRTHSARTDDRISAS
jgi:hypothetical protein